MPVPTNDKFRAYARYMAHCLQLVTVIKDQESRAVLREMAAEWMHLADELSDPHERKVYDLRGRAKRAAAK